MEAEGCLIIPFFPFTNEKHWEVTWVTRGMDQPS